MISLDENNALISQRKYLLPFWIKQVGWYYVFMGIFSLPLTLFTKIYTDLFGIIYLDNGLSIELILIVLIYFFLGITAFGLIRGKKWGLNACIINGYIGIIICLVITFLNLSNGLSAIRLEPIIQIIYLLKLYEIKHYWYSINKKPLG